MTVFLAFAIWIGASALIAPAIGHLLFSLSSAYPAVHPAHFPPPSRRSPERASARRRALHNSWTRNPLAQSKAG